MILFIINKTLSLFGFIRCSITELWKLLADPEGFSAFLPDALFGHYGNRDTETSFQYGKFSEKYIQN